MAREFTPRREGPDDLFAAMPPLGAQRALFAYVAGVRAKRRDQGQDEVELMCIDEKRAHLFAKCDEEERGRIDRRTQQVCEVCQAEEVNTWSEGGIVRMERRPHKEAGE